MENAEALGTAANAKAREIEGDTCASMESHEHLDRQREDDKKHIGGDDIPLDLRTVRRGSPVSVAVDSGEKTRSDELIQNVSLPSQQVSDFHAEARSSMDVPGGSAGYDQRRRDEGNVAEMSDSAEYISSAIPRRGSPVSVTVDSGEQTRSDELIQYVSLPSQQVSDLRAELRSSMDVPGGSADNDQRRRDVGNVAEIMSETAEYISSAIPYGDIAKHVGKLVIFVPVLRETLHDALPRASLVIEKEKEMEQRGFAVFGSVLKTVASKSSDLKSRAEELFAKCVAVTDSDGRKSLVNAVYGEIIVNLDQRLKTVEDYVRVAYVKSKDVLGANTSYNEQKKQKTSTVTSEAPMNSGATHANIIGKYILPTYYDEALFSIVRKRLMENENVEWPLMVNEYVKLRKFCALGSVYAYKIKLGCGVVLKAAFTAVKVVRPALESTLAMREAFVLVGECEAKGSANSAFLTLSEVKVPLELAFSALTHAEAIMKFHSAVILHLKDARRQLESMMGEEVKFADVIYHGNRFRKCLRGYRGHPSRIRGGNITERKTEAAFMKKKLSHMADEVHKGASRDDCNIPTAAWT